MKRSKYIQKLNSKTFQALYEDALVSLNLAEKYSKQHTALVENNKIEFSQEPLRLQKSFARACIVLSIASLESFANAILADYKPKDFKKENLDLNWFNSRQKKHINRATNVLRLPLEDKVFIIPSICRSKQTNPNSFFKNKRKMIDILSEIKEIRNSIAHGKVEEILVTIYSDKRIDFKHEQNYWPITKIPKDVIGIDYSHAKLVFCHIMEMTKFIIENVESSIGLEYLRDQIVEFGNGDTINVVRNADTDKKYTPEWIKLLQS